MTVKDIIAPDITRSTFVSTEIFWSAELEPGEELIIEATYFDGKVRVGKVKYLGQYKNPFPVVPGSNEHLTIPKFEAIGANNALLAGQAKYYRVI